MIDCSLVILAAGIGSRFGGIKQLEPVGPAGEIIMDYSIRDAIRAGFRKIVFLIRRDIAQDFRAVIGDRVEAMCAENGVEVAYAYQEKTDLPEGFTCPDDRTRPWGTGQALLCCKDVVDGPFVVLNADDYYGTQAFCDLYSHLQTKKDWALAGFLLKNTLSCFGGVTRGICRVDENGRLLAVKETRNVRKQGNVITADAQVLDPDVCVSMNMWGFTTEIFQLLEEKFFSFLQRHGADPSKEFLLPEVVDELLAEKKATVQVIPTHDQWYGMTYREDIPIVKAAFETL